MFKSGRAPKLPYEYCLLQVNLAQKNRKNSLFFNKKFNNYSQFKIVYKYYKDAAANVAHTSTAAKNHRTIDEPGIGIASHNNSITPRARVK